MAHVCRACGCKDSERCAMPGAGLVCSPAGDLCSACVPDALPGWVHPSARAIEMDLEIAALLDDVTYGIAPPVRR